MKRIRYYDLLRVVCFSFIIFYHMMIQLQISGIYPAERVTPFFSNTNMHIATLAVAVFFMLSGAGLAYTTKDNCDLVPFYKKRFIRLLIPFYIVEMLYAVWMALFDPNFKLAVLTGVPKWKIFFTLLGMDEWLSMHGVATFSLGIGEWFLGALIILYVLFPLFRYLMLKNGRLFFAMATCIYLIVSSRYSSAVPSHMSLWFKGYEFIIGMFFGCYFTQFNSKWAIITVPLVLFFFISPITININVVYKNTILAAAFFVSFSYLEKILNRHHFKVIDILSRYSYELFLVHHAVIYYITPRFIPYLTNKYMVVILFLIQLVVMAVITVIIKYISGRAIRLISLIS